MNPLLPFILVINMYPLQPYNWVAHATDAIIPQQQFASYADCMAARAKYGTEEAETGDGFNLINEVGANTTDIDENGKQIHWRGGRGLEPLGGVSIILGDFIQCRHIPTQRP